MSKLLLTVRTSTSFDFLGRLYLTLSSYPNVCIPAQTILRSDISRTIAVQLLYAKISNIRACERSIRRCIPPVYPLAQYSGGILSSSAIVNISPRVYR